MSKKTKTCVGIIGCGKISKAYLTNLKTYESVEVVAVADLDRERAAAAAAEFGVPRVCSVEELLADQDIHIVLNLTIPKAHHAVALATLKAGKSVYNEKPLALSRLEGKELLDVALEKSLRVGCAPDTVLGAGYQTCRRIIDDGHIGEPVAATAFMISRGHESWHPDPEFYYEVGGGPLFDMGPYYLTALIHLMGPMKRVSAMTRATFPERTITSEKKRGKKIKVETPTLICGNMEFATGAIGTMIMSFDTWPGTLPFIEIYGTEGTLQCPDPNDFGGAIRLRKAGKDDWIPMPLTFKYDENSRGLGVADMASALSAEREHRASGKVAYHVLDAMHAFLESGEQGRAISLESTCERPAPMNPDLPMGRL